MHNNVSWLLQSTPRFVFAVKSYLLQIKKVAHLLFYVSSIQVSLSLLSERPRPRGARPKPAATLTSQTSLCVWQHVLKTQTICREEVMSYQSRKHTVILVTSAKLDSNTTPWFTPYLFLVFVHELIYRAHVSYATRQDILYTCKYASLRYLLKICIVLSLARDPHAFLLHESEQVTWHFTTN